MSKAPRETPDFHVLPEALRDAIVRAAQPRLLLLNYGFFVYPTGPRDTCEAVVAPRVASVPHQAVLLVPKAVIVKSSEKPVFNGFDLWEIPLARGSRVEVSGLSAPATLMRRANPGNADEPDFDFVPDFTTWCKGVALDPESLSEPDLQSATVRLAGGLLAGCVDGFTCQKRWKWDGVWHRVTALTAHLSVESASFVLQVARGAKTLFITVAPETGSPVAPILLINLPPARSSVSQVNLAHVGSMLQFCAAVDGQPFEILKTTLSADPCSATASPRTVLGGLDNLQQYIESISSIELNGEPQCSGQQIPPP
jgi:hypothetical protein